MQSEKKTYDPRPTRLSFLDGFRGCAIVMVVATHAMAYAKLDDSTSALLSFWVQAAAVPPFFLADGFLFARSLQNTHHFSYAEYSVRSARRLLIPWSCFSILYVAFRAAFEYISHPAHTLVLDRTIGEVLAAVYYSSLSSQMYFLPALFMIRMLSWGTRILALLSPSRLVIVWLAYVWVWQVLPIGAEQGDRIDPLLSAAWGLQYYLLGMVLSIYEKRIVGCPLAVATVGFVCLAVVKIGFPLWGVLAQYLYLGSLFFLFLGLGNRTSPIHVLGRLTMGIYLIHAPVILKVVSSAALVVFDQSSMARYFSTTLGAVLASVLVAILCDRARWWRFILGEKSRGDKPSEQ